MNKLLLLFLFLGISLTASADVIVFRNGDEVKAIVSDITTTEVKYKRASNPNGPTYTVDKVDVFMIKYDNGEKDVFDMPQNPESASAVVTPTIINKEADDHNSELLRYYNTIPPSLLTVSNPKKQGKRIFGALPKYPIKYYYYGFTSTSILSNEDCEIEFVKINVKLPGNRDRGYSVVGEKSSYPIDSSTQHIYIKVNNKSDHILYIDLCNSTYQETGKERIPYSKEGMSSTSGEASSSSTGGSLVGNILLAPIRIFTGFDKGTSSTGSSSTTYQTPRFLQILPHDYAFLTQDYYVLYGGDGTVAKNLGYHEPYLYLVDCDMYNDPYADMSGMYYGQRIDFPDDSSPYTNKYCITYSFSPDFSTFSQMNFTLYLKTIFVTDLDFILVDLKTLFDNRESCIYDVLH